MIHKCLLSTYVDKMTLKKNMNWHLKDELKLKIRYFNYPQNNFPHFYSHFCNQTKPKHSPKQTKLTLLLFH